MSMSAGEGGTPTFPTPVHDPWRVHGTTYGPVPSRRFGRSLGINNIPAKVCSYSCVYCQVGRTVQMRSERRRFYGATAVGAAVRARVEAARRTGNEIDHLSFVPDGEPTLDLDLPATIRSLKPLGIPVAVITNGSLMAVPEVRAALALADRVSLKVDAVREDVWRKVNRPHRRLDLTAILDGMTAFAAEYRGVLTTETMLVAGVNDGEDDLRATAAFVAGLVPATAYLSVPTRPPAESWVASPDEASLARAYEVFNAFHSHVELLLGYEGDAFTSTGDVLADLLGITAVHPMREGAVRRMLEGSGVGWSAIQDLLSAGDLVEVRYGPHRYYLRPVPGRATPRSP